MQEKAQLPAWVQRPVPGDSPEHVRGEVKACSEILSHRPHGHSEAREKNGFQLVAVPQTTLCPPAEMN